MENKINIADLLKDCPKDMELDCTMYDNLYFDSVNADYYGTINCYTLIDGIKTSINFTKYGTFNNHTGAKCVIFPKGKTTWEGFHRPFKDGDIVAATIPHAGTWVGIFKQYYINNEFESYCFISANGVFKNIGLKNHVLVGTRLASEEEQQKLFQAIKENGYKWNEETKTLTKLVEPEFKAGDRIKHKEKQDWFCTIERVEDRYYVDGHPTCYTLPFDKQNEYELVPNKFDITTLKPFESKVLIRDTVTEIWYPAFWGFYDKKKFLPI